MLANKKVKAVSSLSEVSCRAKIEVFDGLAHGVLGRTSPILSSFEP